MSLPAQRLLSSPFFWSAAAGALAAVAIVGGCSTSSSSQGGPSGCDGSACADTGAPVDSAAEAQGGGDAGHDGPSPDALYGACAIPGSFGSPCKATASGPDPTECTDTNFSQCFVGGQGAWCSKTCTTLSDCTAGANDAGCVPTACNGRGFCK